MTAPKKLKKPLDYAMRCLHDAMELVFDYDHDPSFVPNGDQLVLFELIHKQITGHAAMSFIILGTMRRRAAEAASAQTAEVMTIIVERSENSS